MAGPREAREPVAGRADRGRTDNRGIAVRIAITGGTGFVAGHLAESRSVGGHEVVVLARGIDTQPGAKEILGLPGVTLVPTGISEVADMLTACDGWEGVAHCAGINREIGSQTYDAVHIQGTANVVKAADEAGVGRIAHVGVPRARPYCGSPHHESKWAAEEIVRSSTSDWTVLKPGMMFGRGDHILDHPSHALDTFAIFLGIGPRPVRPLAEATS
ncbi:MAG: NAD(P)H-binding protein [Acidimicrobiales bacterium]